MLPARLIGSADGLLFEKIEQNGLPAVAVRSGALAEPVFRGMRRAVAAMADAGNDLVVDDVFWDNELSDYRILPAAHHSRPRPLSRPCMCWNNGSASVATVKLVWRDGNLNAFTLAVITTSPLMRARRPPMDARSRLLTPSDCKSRVSRGHSLI